MNGYMVYKAGYRTPILKSTMKIFNDLEKAGRYFFELGGNCTLDMMYSVSKIRIIDFETGDVTSPLHWKRVEKLLTSEPRLEKEITKLKLRKG